MNLEQDQIISSIFKFLSPFIILFGLYVQINGENSPGGGFQAGVILSCPFILYSMIYGHKALAKILNPKYIKSLCSTGILIYTFVGMYSIIFSNKNFLNYNVLAHDNITGQKLGIMIVELGIGLSIFSTMILIFFCFTKED